MRRLRTIAGLTVVALLLTPLCVMWGSAAQVGGPAELSSPPSDWSRLAISVAVAGGAAVLAVLLGGVLASLFCLTDLPGVSFWATVALIPFVCPHTVWALAQVYCFGPGGIVERQWGDGLRAWLDMCNQGHHAATLLVLAQVHAPLAMLVIWHGAARLHHAGWEAAALFLTPTRRLRWLIGALQAELAGAACLVFAMSLGNFAIPHVLQSRLYIIDLYMRATNYLDQAGAARAALPLVVICLLAVSVVIVIDQRHPQPRGAVARHWRVPLGRAARPLMILLLLFHSLTIGLPLAALVVECRSWALLVENVREAAPETVHTLRLGLLAAVVALAAGLAVRAAPAGTVSIACRALAFVTLGIPALLVGLAYLQTASFLSGAGWEVLRRAGLVLVLGLAFRAWPFTTRSLTATARLASPAWREAAELSGLSSWQRWRWISLPWNLDALLTGAVIAYVVAAGEVEICQMLCEPGQGTLSLRLFTFLHFGPTHVAASLALLELLVTCLPVLIYFLLTDRCLRVV